MISCSGILRHLHLNGLNHWKLVLVFMLDNRVSSKSVLVKDACQGLLPRDATTSQEIILVNVSTRAHAQSTGKREGYGLPRFRRSCVHESRLPVRESAGVGTLDPEDPHLNQALVSINDSPSNSGLIGSRHLIPI